MTATKIERIRLPDLLPEPMSHYTDAVRAGDILWISRMLALDAEGSLVGGGDVVAQTEQVFRHLESVLSHCGAGFEHVTKVTVFLRDVSPRRAHNQARPRYQAAARPARTLPPVSAPP